MSSIVLSPGATGAAAFTIEAPSTATSRVITLPDATDTLVGKATTDTLTNKTLVAPALGTPASGNLANCTGAITSGTAQASTSGTSIDFTGIPSGVKRITVMFGAVSTSGTSNMQAQIGSGSIDTVSTYAGACSNVGGTNNCGAAQNTTGFLIVNNLVAASTYNGALTFTTIGSNIWCLTGTLSSTSSTIYNFPSSGSKTLSGTLDRVRITTVNGTDTFDAGSINILYES